MRALRRAESLRQRRLKSRSSRKDLWSLPADGRASRARGSFVSKIWSAGSQSKKLKAPNVSLRTYLVNARLSCVHLQRLHWAEFLS